MKIGAVIFMGVLAMVLIYTNQANTSSEITSTVVDETTSLYTDLSLLNMYETDYVLEDQENRHIVDSLSYGCRYGDPEAGFQHIVSDSESLIFRPAEYSEQYLNRTVGSNFQLEMDCKPWKDDSVKVKLGEEPPEEGEVAVRSVPVPLPGENYTTARIYRWYN